MIVADTDVLIDFRKRRNPGADAVEVHLEAGILATTIVNVFELLTGARTEKQQLQALSLLDALEILPLDESAAAEAADIRRGLNSRGQGIAAADCLIAGICRHRGLPLMTRNLRHFDRVPGLTIHLLE